MSKLDCLHSAIVCEQRRSEKKTTVPMSLCESRGYRSNPAEFVMGKEFPFIDSFIEARFKWLII